MAKNNNTLVFNGLMQGMSWDLIKEAKDEIKRHLGEKLPTRKDILTDWIIGKDYMLQLLGNTFDLGGFAGIDWKSGNFKYTGENEEPVVGNTNWLGAASSALLLAGDAFSGYNNIENKAEEFNNQLSQFQNQRFNIGDNAFLASEWDNRMLLGDAPTRELFGYKNGWKVGLSALQNGLTTAGTTGNIWLGLGAAGLSAAKDLWLNSEAKEALEEALTRYNIAQGLLPELFNYSADLALRINAFNQLQNMAKNGGKLKKSHRFAEGGLLNTYDYGLEEVNAGGSHEENPNEGVVVSYAPDGLPNKVEEGETIHNDYVYSKRLEANKKVLNNNLLDEKYEGKSFADISKKLTEDRKKRPNDPISIRTNEENLSRLQGALEELKLDNKTREVKRFLGSLNNELLNALQLEMMDEYEAYAELLAQQLEQEDLAYQEEQAALEGMFGRGGHLKQEGSLIKATEPVRNAEGKIVGWKQPDASTEKVLNLPVYNPNYEGALIYADNRNWFLRNIVSPWNTWWNNLPSSEFSLAVRNFTPVGAVDAVINDDTERLLAEGMLGEIKGAFKGAVEGYKEAKAASKAKKIAALTERLRAASTLKGKPKANNIVEMKSTLPAKGLEEGVSSKTVNMEGKEVVSTEAAKLRSWLGRNWKPVVIVGGGLGLGSWGLSEILKEKNPPYNPLTDPNAYNQFLDEGNTRSNLQQTTKGTNTTQHNTGDTSGDTLWVGGTPYNVNTGEKFEKGGHLLLEGKHIGENPWVTLWKNITSPSAPIVPSQWITENIERVKHNNRNNRNNNISDTNNNNNNEVRLAVSSTPMYTEIPFGFTYDSFADDSYWEGPLYKHMLSYEQPKSEENKEKPTVTKKENSVKTSNLPIVSTTPSSSGTIISKPYSNPIIGPEPYIDSFLFTNPNTIVTNTQRTEPIYPNETSEEAERRELIENNYERQLYGQTVGLFDKQRERLNNIAKESLVKSDDRDKPDKERQTNYLSYLRYAPILGSLGLVLSDTLGLTNQPDYSNIDMYRRAVDSIGGVNFVPIGGYLQHTPIDKEYIANQLLALAAAYNRSLNNVNPVGSYILGLVNDAKVRDQIGDMYINAAAQDLKNRLAVAEYNRGIDITNARNSLAAQSENARLRTLRANEYQKIAAMMDNERNTAEAARAANYLGLFTNIGNLGTDEMNRTMVNRNPALFYEVNRDGSIYFKNAFWGLS